MKKLILTTIAALTLTAGSFSAQAACSGCTYVGPVDLDLDLDYLYHWEATVKYRTWYYNQQGQYTSQMNYLELSGTTQQYCQQQVNATTASGATIVKHCTKTRN